MRIFDDENMLLYCAYNIVLYFYVYIRSFTNTTVLKRKKQAFESLTRLCARRSLKKCWLPPMLMPLIGEHWGEC